MTQTNSLYKLRLVNSLEEIIESYIFLEHYDANPRDINLPLNERSSIQLKLIKALPENHELLCEYGGQSFCLVKELGENAFRYQAEEVKMKMFLRSKDKLNKYELES